MRILVLGGTNFVGRAVAQALAARHQVSVLNRGSRPHWSSRINRLIADRTDPGSLGCLRQQRWDAVVDVSATSPDQMSPVLDALSTDRPEAYVLISSAAVYDVVDAARPAREDDPSTGGAAWGDYGRLKAACEGVLAAAGIRRTGIVRPPYLYGPENNEPRESWIWARILAGAPVFVPGDGSNQIQFLHVQDLAATCLSLVEGGLAPGRYNVGDREALSLNAWVALLASVAGEDVDVRQVTCDVPARQHFPFRATDLVLDVSRVESAGAGARTPVRAGLADTLAHLRRHEPERLAYRPNAWELAHR